MLKPSLPDLLYKAIFPRPKQHDPTNFASFIQRNLVAEVRLEVQTFYGAIDCAEAQYPGLDYTFPPHRRRLSRFSAHRKLFRAFDELRLTDNEILAICVWEGTKSAKERWERQEGSAIRDTTADGVEMVERKGPPRIWYSPERCPWEPTSQVDSIVDDDDEQSDDDETDASVGIQLNQQLRAAADARARGEPAVFDEAWEQWMKEAMERNEVSLEVMLGALREGRPFPQMTSPDGPRVVQPRSGQLGDNALVTTHPRSTAAISSTTRTIGNLQAALREFQSANARLTADNAALARVAPRPPTEAAR
jgi:hypothetical protein